MRRSITPALFLIPLFCVGSPFAQGLPNRLTPAETRAGWILLFDGVDKNANFRVGETGTTNSWTVSADSAMASPNTGAMLFTKGSYANFEFKADWRMNQASNSGMFFRVSPTVGWFCSGPEYGILDDVNGGDRTSMLYLPGETTLPGKRTAASYDMYTTTLNGVNGAAYVAAALPFAQWNKGVYWANGTLVEHWLNGQKVVAYDYMSADWQTRFQLSKFWTQCSGQRTTYGKNTTGLIGFQDHGSGLLVWFRNLKVRPFTPGEVLISPLFTPAGGNFTGTVTVVMENAITGSEIRYTTDGSTPTATSPLYTGPLTLSATTTINARSFRPLFGTSVSATATFTRNPTPILHGDLSPLPEISYSQNGGDFMIRNGNGQVFTVEFFSPNGEKAKTVNIGSKTSELSVSGLKAGLYLVKASRGSWSQTHKITLR